MVDDLKALQREFASSADVVLVYITEAHAQNEWPIGSRLKYNQPIKLEERAQIARDFVAATGATLPIYLDVLGDPEFGDNPFEIKFAAWPIRTYLVFKNQLTFIGMPDKGSFSLREFKNAIREASKP